MISGVAACNRFIGSIDVTTAAGSDSFAISDLSWTEMGCDQSAMEIEQSFLTALQVVDSYEAADGLYVTASGVGTIALGGDLEGGGGYLSTDTLAGFTDDQGVLERARVCAEGPYYEVAVLQSV